MNQIMITKTLKFTTTNFNSRTKKPRHTIFKPRVCLIWKPRELHEFLEESKCLHGDGSALVRS